MFNAPSPPPLPSAPPPPPNPPMFGQKATKGQTPGGWENAASKGFAGTLLGSGNPTNTGQKTLLGQ